MDLIHEITQKMWSVEIKKIFCHLTELVLLDTGVYFVTSSCQKDGKTPKLTILHGCSISCQELLKLVTSQQLVLFAFPYYCIVRLNIAQVLECRH